MERQRVEIKDNLTWIKGRHTFKIGASMLSTTFWSRFYGNRAGVLSYTFGVRSDDPTLRSGKQQKAC